MARKNQINSLSQGMNFGIDPEALDFSQDTWAWKGDAPSYPIQSDGFSYDLIDENEIERNAISLGILGMIIIVFNAKSAKIKEEDVQPVFKEVIGTRNWNTIPLKDANKMAKTVVGKLVDESTSDDVFDLASFAPLEIKRALLRKLFGVARKRLAPEYRAEAERRILEDIVPSIFADPEFELALLTGLIMKPKTEEPEKTAAAASEPVPAAIVEPAAETVEADAVLYDEEELVVPDRDAEKALREHLETLSTVVPPKPEIQPEPEDDYVPFSDMEKAMAQTDLPEQLPTAAPAVKAEAPVSAVPPIYSAPVPAQQPRTVDPAVIPPAYAAPAPAGSRPVVPPPPAMGNVAKPPVAPQSGYPGTSPQTGYPAYPVPQPPPYGAYPAAPQVPPREESAGYPPMEEPPAIEHTQPRKPRA